MHWKLSEWNSVALKIVQNESVRVRMQKKCTENQYLEPFNLKNIPKQKA